MGQMRFHEQEFGQRERLSYPQLLDVRLKRYQQKRRIVKEWQACAVALEATRKTWKERGWVCVCVCVCVLFFLVFLGPHLWHMEFPRLGVKSEL